MAAGLGFATQASAATLGQTTPVGAGTIACGGDGVLLDPGYVVPAGGGVITSFSFQSTADQGPNPAAGQGGQQLNFILWRPANDGTPGDYTIAGATPLETLAGTGLETFAANIPAKAGDVLGIYAAGDADFPTLLFDENCAFGSAGSIASAETSFNADPGVVYELGPGGPATIASGEDLNESANLAAATTLTAAPLLATLLDPTARLTQSGTGAPLAGQTVTFKTGATTVCSATTNPRGVASCHPGTALISLARNGFTATYSGSSAYAPSTGTAKRLL